MKTLTGFYGPLLTHAESGPCDVGIQQRNTRHTHKHRQETKTQGEYLVLHLAFVCQLFYPTCPVQT